MAFYKQLSEYYDSIFPVDATEMRFVSGVLAGRKRILDIGCGTGNKTVLLAREDAEIIAIDNDAGMIETAATANAGPNIRYILADMAEPGLALSGAGLSGMTFDGAVCLGNTLVHLTTPRAIGTLLRDTARFPAPGGVFVAPILHYHRPLDRHIPELPRL